MSQEIAFRRIRGRIVPIKLNKQKRETIKGAAIAGSGAAIALGGASIYKRAVTASVKLAKKGFDLSSTTDLVFGKGGKKKFQSAAQTSFDDILAASRANNSSKAFAAANKLSKFSSFVRKASPIIGAGLFAYGATKIINENKKKKLSPELTALVGAVGAGGLKPAYEASKKVFEFGLQNRQTKMKFASTAASNFTKAFLKKIF